MAWALVYSAAAKKDVEDLDPVIRKRIGKKILTLQNDPLSHAKKLVDFKPPLYRFRAGDYRVIFELGKGKIFILRIGHRSTIYR